MMFKTDVQVLKYIKDFASNPVDISNYSIGSVELHVSECTAGTSSAKVQVSNDRNNWFDGSTSPISIAAGAAKYFSAIELADMCYRYLRLDYDHSATPPDPFVCTQKIILKQA